MQLSIATNNDRHVVINEASTRTFGTFNDEHGAKLRRDNVQKFADTMAGMTVEELIAAHSICHLAKVSTANLVICHDVIEDLLEGHSIAPPYTCGDTGTKIAALHNFVPFTKAEERYTLGPVYVPGQLDGHGEFIDAPTLQKAIWDWVRSGDRTIYLQHSEKAAGEMVEVLTWPMPIETLLSLPGEEVRKVEFPEDTPFMGVIWEPWAWELIKAGQLRGYSIGGKARRVEADIATESLVEQGSA